MSVLSCYTLTKKQKIRQLIGRTNNVKRHGLQEYSYFLSEKPSYQSGLMD